MGGGVDERYVTLGGGGCTVQRYETLQGGGGCQVFRKKALLNTQMAPYLNNSAVYQLHRCLKGNRHKPDLKIRFWCVYIP